MTDDLKDAVERVKACLPNKRDVWAVVEADLLRTLLSALDRPEEKKDVLPEPTQPLASQEARGRTEAEASALLSLALDYCEHDNDCDANLQGPCNCGLSAMAREANEFLADVRDSASPQERSVHPQEHSILPSPGRTEAEASGAGELLPCPFCGSEAEIERYGDARRSTIYQCTNCSCSLETGEEWDHGRAWNRRATPSGGAGELREKVARIVDPMAMRSLDEWIADRAAIRDRMPTPIGGWPGTPEGSGRRKWESFAEPRGAALAKADAILSLLEAPTPSGEKEQGSSVVSVQAAPDGANETQYSAGERAYFKWRDEVPDHRRGQPTAQYGFVAGYSVAAPGGRGAEFWRDDALSTAAEIVRRWFGPEEGEACARDIEQLLSSGVGRRSPSEASAATETLDEPILPSGGAGELREKVARIVDPSAWEARDKEPSIPKWKNKGPDVMDWERYRELGCKPSLTKADAILSLLEAPPLPRTTPDG